MYIEKYTEILMFVLLAEKDICKFTRVVRNQSQVASVQREQNRTVNFKLNCLKQLCQSYFRHCNKSKGENRLQI